MAVFIGFSGISCVARFGRDVGDARFVRVGVHVDHAAVATHFQALSRRPLKHAVTCQFAQHGLDGFECAKRLAASHAA